MEMRKATINDAEQLIALINARRELLSQKNTNTHDLWNLPVRKKYLIG